MEFRMTKYLLSNTELKTMKIIENLLLMANMNAYIYRSCNCCKEMLQTGYRC